MYEYLEFKVMLIHELFQGGVDRNPDGTYIGFNDERYSYREFDERAAVLVNVLREIGVSKGDKVGVLSPNCPEIVELLLACSRLGAVLTPTDPALEEATLSHNLGLSETTFLVAAEDCLEKADAVEPDTEVETIVTLAEVDELRAEQSASNEPVQVSSDDPVVHMYTSGTTGDPKACELTHETWTKATTNFADRFGMAPSDNLASCHPLHHGILWTSALTPAAVGATFVLFEEFSSSQWWDWMREYDVTMFLAIGGLLRMLGHLPKSPDERRHDVDRVYTAKILPELEDRFDIQMVSGYGLSESPFLCMNPIEEDRRKVESVGYPSPHKQIRIVDEEGHEVPRGTTGEIIMKSPSIMPRYYNDPDKTEAAFEESWFYTGDIGKRDEEGFVYFVDRKKHIIRRSGENISSETIEVVIQNLPGVKTVAVIPSPDEIRGQEIKAVIEVHPNKELSPEAVLAHCKSELPEFKWPRYVEFVNEIPTSPTTGRIQKTELEDREKKETPEHWEREADS
jgi:crotonobetaine/carnitine-CoA ligase